MHARLAGSLLAALLLSSSACVHRGGPWRLSASTETSPTAQGGISLIALGEPAPGGSSRRVAARLDRVLQQERERGATVVLLWTGDNVFPRGVGPGAPCVSSEAAWRRPGLDALAEVARAHVAGGGHSFAVLGHRDWLCGQPEAQLHDDPASSPHPFAMPDHNYVVRVGGGEARVVSSCDGGTCVIEPAADPKAIELVFLDVTPWVHHHDLEPRAQALGELVLAQQAALLEALMEARGPQDPVRVLVTHVPAESAGAHGLAGARPTATFRRLPPPLRAALERGFFRGIVSAQDRSLQLTEDLSGAVARSAKVFVDRPFFQIVSGAASRPDARAVGSRRQLPYFQGLAVEPDAFSNHAGFAVLRAEPERLELELQAHRAGRWVSARRTVPARPEPHGAERSVPSMTPCLRCDPVQGAADADKRPVTW